MLFQKEGACHDARENAKKVHRWDLCTSVLFLRVSDPHRSVAGQRCGLIRFFRENHGGIEDGSIIGKDFDKHPVKIQVQTDFSKIVPGSGGDRADTGFKDRIETAQPRPGPVDNQLLLIVDEDMQFLSFVIGEHEIKGLICLHVDVEQLARKGTGCFGNIPLGETEVGWHRFPRYFRQCKGRCNGL